MVKGCEGTFADAFDAMEDNRLLRIFTFFAEKGTGIELSAVCTDEDGKMEEALLYIIYPRNKVGNKSLGASSPTRFWSFSYDLTKKWDRYPVPLSSGIILPYTQLS